MYLNLSKRLMKVMHIWNLKAIRSPIEKLEKKVYPFSFYSNVAK